MSEYHTLLRDAQSRYSLSLHEPTGVEGEQALLESLPNEDADASFEQIDKDSYYNYVATLIKELPEREQTILALYYFEDLTLREIASLLSLTEARISQILGKILLTLRTRLNETRSMAA